MSTPANDATSVRYLERSPAPFAARALSLLIALAVSAAVLVTTLVPVPETVSAPFLLVREGPSALISAPHAGVVERVHVGDGDAVEKGQPLLVVRSQSHCPPATPAVVQRGAATGSFATPPGPERAWCPVSIRAPDHGVVGTLKAWKPGDRVDSGEPLLTLAGTDPELVAEIVFEEEDFATVGVGNEVSLLFRALPSGRYGVWQGRVSTVGTAIEGGKLRARATIDSTSVLTKGQTLQLRPGMTGEARIHTQARTLIEHLFTPLRELRENTRGSTHH